MKENNETNEKKEKTFEGGEMPKPEQKNKPKGLFFN